MAEYGYTPVAEEYRGSRSRLYTSGREKTAKGKESFSRNEILRWGRLLLCAAVFLALVVTKVQMPERFESLRAVFSDQMEQSVDYREVFSVVGRAVSGETSVSQAVNDVYMEVFHPNQEQGQAVETAAAISGIEFSQQEPVNVLLAFSQHWNQCGDWLYQQGSRDTLQTAGETAVETTPVQSGTPNTAEQEVLPAETSADSETVYDAETLPEGVSMEQQVLNLSYTTPVSGWLSSPFGYREHPIEGEEKFHRGLDIAAAEGSDIVAFADGVVKATGESSSLGKYIMVSHDGNLTTIYGHCSKITASGGESVKKGNKIAEVGHTGMATGSHLHFAMQQGEMYLNPIYYVSLEKAPE